MKLQNNFTTPEQSKRLLELGMPANSADLGIVEDIMHGGVEILQVPYSQWCEGYENISTPCWSVGRLIEIFRKLCPFEDIIGELIMMNDDIAESFVNEFENPNVKWDFSKLED